MRCLVAELGLTLDKGLADAGLMLEAALIYHCFAGSGLGKATSNNLKHAVLRGL